MQNDSHTEYVNINFVNWLLFIVQDDFGRYKPWGTTLCENDGLLMLKGRQSIINNFQSFSCITFFKSVLGLKQNVLRFDITMHDVSIGEVLDSLKKLFDDSSDLVGLKLFLFLSVLDLLVKCDAFK